MSAIQRYTYKVGTIQTLGGQQVANLNHLQAPFNASVVVDIVSGVANYSVEFTTDDLTATVPANLRWLPLPNLAPGQTTTQQYTLSFPVTAVRLNLASLTGEVRLAVSQGLGLPC
jgi:hypothetical protein